MQAIVGGVLARWFTPRFLASDSPTVPVMRQMLADTDPTGYIATCIALRDMDQRELMQSINCPTQMVAGEQDTVTTISDSLFLEASIPGSILETLAAAHISNMELPEHFNTKVFNFLTKDGVDNER